MENVKYIIRECEPETIDFSYFFDNDGLRAAGGDYCYNVFIIENRYNSGYNTADYNELKTECENVLCEIDYLLSDSSEYKNIKEIMTDYKLHYNPQNAHILKKLCRKYYRDYTSEILTEYLKVKTGENWNTTTARGYSQGDWNTILYCEKYNTPEQINIIGDLWQGCGKEFCIISLDDQNNEIESCFGYFVADCQVRYDADYKSIVCRDAGIPENNTTLELIENSYTTTHYTYKAV